MTHKHFRICVEHGTNMDECVASVPPSALNPADTGAEGCTYMCGSCTSHWPCKVEIENTELFVIQADHDQHVALTKAALALEDGPTLEDCRGLQSVKDFRDAVAKSKDLLDIL